MSPDEALARLMDGNARFAAGQPSRPRQDTQRREQLALGQEPFAAVFGCADSRVPAEIVFDQGLGDLFVCRTAGHAVDDAVLGSIDFAVQQLHVPLVVVLGHESCGAIKAAWNAFRGDYTPEGNVHELVARVLPAVIAAERAASSEQRGATDADVLARAVAENVWLTVDLLLKKSSVLATAAESGTCRVVGAIYGLDQGQAILL